MTKYLGYFLIKKITKSFQKSPNLVTLFVISKNCKLEQKEDAGDEITDIPRIGIGGGGPFNYGEGTV